LSAKQGLQSKATCSNPNYNCLEWLSKNCLTITQSSSAEFEICPLRPANKRAEVPSPKAGHFSFPGALSSVARTKADGNEKRCT
ncbi:MAG TPA: hypothetical protein VF974_03935, partial [Patescibacteria group bacterium]